jgi:hypothetical protein
MFSLFANKKQSGKLLRAAPEIDQYLCNYAIGNAILNRTPFLASRLGWLESYAVGEYDEIGKMSSGIKGKLWNTPGIFPETDELFERFHKIFTEAISHSDLLGLLKCPYEKSTIVRHGKLPLLCELRDLEPYFSPTPWSAHLKGKKVLVVHPFQKSIEQQYRKSREKIFIHPLILPEFDLITLRPPQTICGNRDGFVDWVDAYKSTVEKIGKIKFDVAIVGSGSYGLPLGAFIKSLGKVCVHLGGSTQNLFGITGGRWMKMPQFRAMLNPYWVRPLEEERPPNWEKAENGCYW